MAVQGGWAPMVSTHEKHAITWIPTHLDPDGWTDELPDLGRVCPQSGLLLTIERAQGREVCRPKTNVLTTEQCH